MSNKCVSPDCWRIIFDSLRQPRRQLCWMEIVCGSFPPSSPGREKVGCFLRASAASPAGRQETKSEDKCCSLELLEVRSWTRSFATFRKNGVNRKMFATFPPPAGKKRLVVFLGERSEPRPAERRLIRRKVVNLCCWKLVVNEIREKLWPNTEEIHTRLVTERLMLNSDC